VIRPIRIGFIFGLLGLSVFFAALAEAQSRDEAMDAAAAQIGSAISDTKVKSVIVFDFSGPDKKITALGQKLADDFNSALERSASGIKVESRARIANAMRQDQFYLPLENDPASTLCFADDLHVKSLVVGELSIDLENLTAEISAYRVPDGKPIKGLQITLPLTEEIRGLLAKDLTNVAPLTDSDTPPRAGTNGYTYASCVQCPRADYSDAALKRRIQGIVELVATITADGHVTDIRVLKPLPCGLTQTAIKAVKSWRLLPAKGPDGKPAAVRQMVELTFQLFR